MKKCFLFLLFLSFYTHSVAQKYLTQNGQIKFFSEAPLENIEANNNQVSSVINFDNGDIAFSLLLKAFSFEKALMQEHFNEKYIESDKYPKATFKGAIINFDAASLGAEETEVEVKGTLSIHGVSREVSAKGMLRKEGDNKLIGKSVFTILVEDYKIKIPAAVKDNISKTIEITVNLEYEKM